MEKQNNITIREEKPEKKIKNLDDQEWYSVADLCQFFDVSRSYFRDHFRGKIREQRWSPKKIKFHREDVKAFNDQLIQGAVL